MRQAKLSQLGLGLELDDIVFIVVSYNAPLLKKEMLPEFFPLIYENLHGYADFASFHGPIFLCLCAVYVHYRLYKTYATR